MGTQYRGPSLRHWPGLDFFHMPKTCPDTVQSDASPTLFRPTLNLTTLDGCKKTPAILHHMFWSCPILVYLVGLLDTISYMIAIFGMPPDDLNLPICIQNVIAFSSPLAGRTILHKWKAESHPSHWITVMMENSKLGSALWKVLSVNSTQAIECK